MENKLHVENLTISFRTSNGKVQAVRGINFDLQKGETLAIVGESGSGKSVTSKAILGILEGNAITEGGEIIYDGKDLLKIPEEEFHKIRGDKIAMIFQDPMSSLNPIIKIGRQLTEAMLLKGKARQKESRETFNRYLKALKTQMIAALGNGNPATIAALEQKCKDFDTFEYKHLDLEGAYNTAYNAAEQAISDIERILFEAEKSALTDADYRLKHAAKLAETSINDWVVSDDAEQIRAALPAIRTGVRGAEKKGMLNDVAVSALQTVLDILRKALDREAPNFFALGYYLTFSPDKTLPAYATVEELNVFLRRYLDDNFMLDFIADAKCALQYSSKAAVREMSEAVDILKQHRVVFTAPSLDKKATMAAIEAMSKEVIESIDPLSITRDSMVYIFGPAMKSEWQKYFDGIKKNITEEKRYNRQKAAYDRIVAKGKTPEGEVVPASITDLKQVQETMLTRIDRLILHFEQLIALQETRDFDADTVAVIDFLKANASGVVHKVTKAIAKARAIKLMEEVGIPEPRKRYNQYPFEFSGGMRQRIVIAIALAADPDILICDEPTTALDVTIQSQILELINKIKAERQLSIIFITHDLGVVANMADRIAVMYAGKIVEYGTAEDIFYRAAHPYTWALLSSMPDLDTNEKLDAIPGTPPNMIYPPVGDAFAARNKYAMQIDFERQPPMFHITDTHHAATWLLHPDAPKIDPPKTITDRIARMKAKEEARVAAEAAEKRGENA